MTTDTKDLSSYAEHELRVIEEHKQLEERIGKLVKFVASDIFMRLPPSQQGLMKRQYKVMTEYSDILAERIKGFAV